MTDWVGGGKTEGKRGAPHPRVQWQTLREGGQQNPNTQRHLWPFLVLAGATRASGEEMTK